MTLATLLAATTTTAAKSSSSSSSYFLLVLLVLFGGIYFMVLRPRQKKAQQAARTGKAFEVGDEVITIGGVCGTVISIDDDRVVLATGIMPGDSDSPKAATHMTFLRQAIARKAEPPVTDETSGSDGETEAGGSGDQEGTST
jgi:preprotein translocase subunit YajC